MLKTRVLLDRITGDPVNFFEKNNVAEVVRDYLSGWPEGTCYFSGGNPETSAFSFWQHPQAGLYVSVGGRSCVRVSVMVPGRGTGVKTACYVRMSVSEGLLAATYIESAVKRDLGLMSGVEIIREKSDMRFGIALSEATTLDPGFMTFSDVDGEVLQDPGPVTEPVTEPVTKEENPLFGYMEDVGF